MCRSGTSGATYLPDDETCFHVFEAASTDIVEEAGRCAELGRVRIVPAVETSRRARRARGKFVGKGIRAMLIVSRIATLGLTLAMFAAGDGRAWCMPRPAARSS